MTATVQLGCGIDGLGSMQAGSVDLVLCDPPSGETAADFDVRPNLWAFWIAAWQALKPSGAAVCFASSLSFAADLIASSRNFRYDIVWHKTLATGHLNARRRPLRAHEFILVFYREEGTYNRQMSDGHGPIHQASRRIAQGHGENYGKVTRETHSRAGATDRYPTSVLRFSCVGTSSKRRTHPQQKPEPLLQWLTRTYSNPGDLVVDPFAGSGSGGRAAEAEGRRWLGWDIDARFGAAAPAIPEEGPTKP